MNIQRFKKEGESKRKRGRPKKNLTVGNNSSSEVTGPVEEILKEKAVHTLLAKLNANPENFKEAMCTGEKYE